MPGSDSTPPDAGPPLGWLARIGYAAGSALVSLWVIGMLVAAGPGSYTMEKVYPVFAPVLGTLNIDNDWGFFAPDPGPGSVARYVVRDVHGETHEFALTEALERWSGAYFRFTTLYMAVAESPTYYLPGAVAFLCRRHADLEPLSITVILANQLDITPEEFIEGTDPMDALEIEKVGPRKCSDPRGEQDPPEDDVDIIEEEDEE